MNGMQLTERNLCCEDWGNGPHSTDADFEYTPGTTPAFIIKSSRPSASYPGQSNRDSTRKTLRRAYQWVNISFTIAAARRPGVPNL